MRWEHVLIPTLPPHLLDYCGEGGGAWGGRGFGKKPGVLGTPGARLHGRAPSVVRSAPLALPHRVHASLAEVAGAGLDGTGGRSVPSPPEILGHMRPPHSDSPMQRVREKALEGCLRDDERELNTLETPFDDVQALPPDVVSVAPLPASHLIRWRAQAQSRSSAARLSPRCPTEGCG